MTRPKLIEGDIDLTTVRKICEEHIDHVIENDGEPHRDFEGHVFEETMTALYGQAFHDWYNELLR